MTIASVSSPAAPAAGSAAPTPSGQGDPAAAVLFGLLVGQHLGSAQAVAQAPGPDVAPAAPGSLAPAVLTTPLPTPCGSTDGTTAVEEAAPEAVGGPVSATTPDPAVAALVAGLQAVAPPVTLPSLERAETSAAEVAAGAAGAPLSAPPPVPEAGRVRDAARPAVVADDAAGQGGQPVPGQPVPGPTALPSTGTTPATTLAATPDPAGAAPAPGPRSALLDQVLPAVPRVVLRGDGTSRLTLKLHPADLGEVHLTVTVRGHQVDVTMAAGARAREALDEGSARLRGLLEGMGHTAGQVVIRDLAGPPAPANASAPTPSGPDHPADGGPSGHPEQQTDGRPHRGRPGLDAELAPHAARADSSTHRLPPAGRRHQPYGRRTSALAAPPAARARRRRPTR
jgi:hypothetical protein